MVYSEYDPSLDRRESPRINWMTSQVQVVMHARNTKHRILGWVLDVSPVGFKVKAETPQKPAGVFGISSLDAIFDSVINKTRQTWPTKIQTV